MSAYADFSAQTDCWCRFGLGLRLTANCVVLTAEYVNQCFWLVLAFDNGDLNQLFIFGCLADFASAVVFGLFSATNVIFSSNTVVF